MSTSISSPARSEDPFGLSEKRRSNPSKFGVASAEAGNDTYVPEKAHAGNRLKDAQMEAGADGGGWALYMHAGLLYFSVVRARRFARPGNR